MTIEKCKNKITRLEEIISPIQQKIECLKNKLEMLNYNEFRQDIQTEIEILQKKLPHLGKFYFDDRYDFYDNHTLYYIYCQNEFENCEEKYITDCYWKIFEKYGNDYTFVICREPYDIYCERIFGRDLDYDNYLDYVDELMGG